MQLRRCTQGVCVLSLILISCALILDSMAILLAGGTLVAGILGQYLLFDNQVREIVRSAEVRRSLSRNPVRKGTPLQVTTRFSFQGSVRMNIRITDLLPPNTVLVDWATSVTTSPDPSGQTRQFRYRITPLVHGAHHFPGVSVNIRNLFFDETIALSRKPDREPTLSVLPTGLFMSPTSESAEGTRDNRKASMWSSIDLHSLREYNPGDDLRHVDWKLSAKFNKLFIRKYSSPISFPPLIIVDLPWNGAPYPEDEFSRMISEVTGMVSHTLQAYQHISVLFISGPNVLHLIRDEKNSSRCMAQLREWMHPAERPVHFYHMQDRTDLRSRVRDIEETTDQATESKAGEFLDLLRDRFISVLQYQRNPAFAGQIARTISQILMTDVYLFSLGCGDTSHIRHIVRPLQTQHIRVNVRIIDASRPGRIRKPDSFLPSRKVQS